MSAKFDGIRLTEATFDVTGPPSLSGTFVYLQRKTGITHGWTRCTSWSPQTLKLFEALRVSMEQDVLRRDFSDVPTQDEGDYEFPEEAPEGVGIAERIGG